MESWAAPYLRRAAGGLAVLVLLISATPVPSAAGTYPEHTIRLIVPFAAGGPTDLFARVVADRAGALLGQQIVIENRGGAGGNIGAEQVVVARPDGYTLLFASAAIAIAPTLYRALAYDPLKDLEPIAVVGAVPLVLVVRPGVPATLPDLLAYLRARPGKLSYGSAGNGTTTHLTVELFKSRAGLDVLHVPYRGSAPAIQELLAGRYDFTIETLSAVKPFIASGQLIPVGIASARRSPLMETVPTLAELGLPGVIGATWNMILAPTGTPQAIIDRLNQALCAALSDPSVVARLTELAIEPIADTTPTSAREFLVDEIARWAPVVQASGATVD
jgi:tripartite-type tricarboxylate transporter receptor subunit TctC